MTNKNRFKPKSSSKDHHGGCELDLLLADYIDQLNAGVPLDHEKIKAEHPELAAELLSKLEAFQGIEVEFGQCDPLRNLGDYTLRRQIGRGGMGTVYDAWQNSMDRRVALKVLPRALAADTRAATRFLREAQIAGKLDHPNVVHVHGTGVEEQVPYYAMEFVEGETLSQILARIKDAEPETETPFGPRDQVDYFAKLARAFADVADGLQHAHSKGVTHRDIKPSNLILDGEGRLRILDFGLARLEGQESLTLSGDFVGTPLYMSPEQARRKKIPVDHRTDIYSLGATMYEAICGRPPFRGKDHADTLSQIIERDPVEPQKVNPRVPNDIETIVLKCLRKEASDRYGTAEALGQDLRRFVRGAPIEARPLSRFDRLVRNIARHWLATGLAAGACFLVALVFWLVMALSASRAADHLREYEAATLEGVKSLHLGHAESELEGGTVFHRQQLTQFDLLEPASTPTGAADESLRRLQSAAELFPERPEARYVLARVYRARKDYEAARAALDLVLETNPGFTPARALRADVLRRLGEEDEARADIELAERDDPDWMGPWKAAREARRSGEWNVLVDAVTALHRLEIERGESYPGALNDLLLQRGIARLEADRSEEAKRDFAGVHSAWPDALAPVLLLGQTYADQDDLGAADRWFEEWWGDHEGEVPFPEWSILSIDGIFQNEIPQPGRNELRRKWVERAPQGITRDLALMGILAQTDPAEALEVAEASRERYPDSPEILAQYAHVLSANGRYDDAEDWIERALRRGRESKHVATVAMLVYQILGRLPDVETMAWKRIELGHWSAYFDVGYALLAQGKNQEAVEILERRIKEVPSDALARLRLFYAYRLVGRFEDARTQAEKLRGADLAFWQEASYHTRAVSLMDYGRADEAENVLRQCVQRYPETWAALTQLGNLLFQRDRWAAAYPFYVRGIKHRPNMSFVPPRFYLRYFERLALILGTSPELLDASGAVSLEEALTGYQELYLDSWSYWSLLAIVRATLEKHGDAEDAISRATELNAGQETIAAARSAVAGLRGDILGAIRALEGRLRLPGHPKVLARLDELRRGALPRVASFESVDAAFASASVDLARAIRREVGDNQNEYGEALVRYVVARALLHDEDSDRAIESLREARALAPDSHVIAAALAQALAHSGQAQEGELVLREQIVKTSTRTASWHRRQLWNRWASFGYAELGWSAAEALESFPAENAADDERGESQKSPRMRYPREDMNWILETLTRGEPLRIDCGVARTDRSPDEEWTYDRFFRDGLIREEPYEKDLAGDANRAHRTLRVMPSSDAGAGYDIPLPVGPYEVTLHFADTLSNRPDKRRFDVVIESEPILRDFAPARNGYAFAESASFKVEVADGLLEIDFVRKVRSAIISGIEVRALDG